MKTPSILLILTALPWLASAQDTPPPFPPPPAPPEPAHAVDKAAAEAPSTVTWLGVAVDYMEPQVRAQLPIPDEQGLIITATPPDSPAAKAGLKPFDILYKLDDQILVTPEQLSKLVRSKKAGEPAKLTLFRGGKQEQIDAVLGLQEVSKDGPRAAFSHDMNPAREQGLEWLRSQSGDAPEAHAYRQLLEFKQQVPNLLIPGYGGPGGNVNVVIDDVSTTRITADDKGNKTIEVKDKNGKEIFSGPWNTPEDMAKAPDDVRKRFAGPPAPPAFGKVPGWKEALRGQAEEQRREAMKMAENARRAYDETAQKFPKMKLRIDELKNAEKIEDIVKEQTKNLEKQLESHQRELEEARRKIEAEIEKLRDQAFGHGEAGGSSSSGSGESSGSSSASMSVADGSGSVTKNIKDGVAAVIVKDKDGKVTFEGPWTTEEDRARAPKEVRERIEALMPEKKEADEVPGKGGAEGHGKAEGPGKIEFRLKKSGRGTSGEGGIQTPPVQAPEPRRSV